MSAVSGDHVTPGMSVSLSEGVEAGEGVHLRSGGAVATLTGNLVEKDGILSVESVRTSANFPKIGDVVIGQVNRLNAKTAEIRVLHIEGKDDGHRDIPALKLFADIFVTEFVDRYMPSAGDAMRSRDIVRARITNIDPMLKASTREDPELGVLHAICPACSETLMTSDATPDFNVACPRCDYTGYRVLSNGFGHGYALPDGVDVQSLNRPGERWSEAAEATLGHDGARPYLSPLADHRRGIEHEIPASAARLRPSRGRGGAGGGRPQREMHKSTCTLCSTATEVPFKPTPGKPIRCRDCMNKVNDGEATKEELAAEREILKAARAKAEETMGMKLFVGSVSWDATEDNLRELFSAHGELKEVHIATDRDTGKSKGFAFITFANKKEGLAAVKELDGSEFLGRKISVQESNSGGGRGGRGRNDRGGRGGRRPQRN